jgi:hypothetical protein
LNDAHAIFATLRLHWNHVMSALAIHTDIHFVSFNLPEVWDACAQMALKRIAGDARKDVDEAIVAKLCKKRLFIAKCIFDNHSRRCVGHLDSRK